MALNDYEIIVDTSTGEAISSFFTNQAANLPPIKQGDTIRLLISAVKRNPNANADPSRPWVYQTLPANLRVGVGIVGAAPSTGSFTLTYGANTTTALAYNSTAAQVATALNLLASIISAGGVSVEGETGGPYRVVFNTVGVRTDFTGNGDLLYPPTGVTIVPSREGTVAISDIQTIILERQTDAYADDFDDFPLAGVTVETLQDGATGVAEVQRIILSPAPYGGTFTLTFDGETTGAIPYNATAEELKEALWALSGITPDDPDTTDDESDIDVTGASPVWTVSFKGLLTGDQPEMTGDASGLLVPVGKIGELDLNTDGIATLVGAGETTVSLEIESVDEPYTILQQNVTLINDLVPQNPVGPTPLPAYMLKSVYDHEESGHIMGQDGSDATASGGEGGTLDMDGGDAAGSQGGGAGGSITARGGNANAADGGAAGSINVSGSNAIGATPGNDGGSINTSAGGTGDGGSINTSNGGGSIDTTGTGSVQFGEDGTRTTLNGSASSNRTVTLPNFNCTLAAAGSITTANNLTMATNRLLGRTTASAGAIEEIQVGVGLAFASGVLSGKLLQAVPLVLKTDASTSGSNSAPTWNVAMSGSITTVSASSRVVILAWVEFGATTGYQVFARLERGGTALHIGDAASNRIRSATGFRYDSNGRPTDGKLLIGEQSPGSIGTFTYDVTAAVESGGTWYVNRGADDTDASHIGRYISAMLLLEFA